MNVLFVSRQGDGLGMAWKIRGEDHNVTLSGPGSGAGQGIYNKVSSWRKAMSSNDFVIFDEPGYGSRREVLTLRGCKLFCCDVVTDLLHYNLDKQHQLFKAMGLSVSDDIVSTEFVVQGFFDGREFAQPLIAGIEVYEFMPSNLGLLTDSMGCLCKALQVGELHEIVLSASPFLKRLGFKGIITFGFKYDGDVLEGTAISCGFHHDISEAVAEGLRGSLLDTLYFTSQGMLRELPLTDDIMVAIRLSTPPWPYPPQSRNGHSIEIGGLDDHNLPHIFLCDVNNKDGKWFCGSRGIALKATARGRTVREAVRRVYRTLSGLDVDCAQYRNDMRQTFIHRLRDLKDRGLFDGIQY